MALDAGEVQARLTANDQMSAAITQATERVAALQAQIASLGNVTGPTLQMLQQNLAGAQASLAAVQQAAQGAGQGVAGAGQAATDSGEQFSQMDRIATRLVERLLVLYALRESYAFVKGLFEGAAALTELSAATDLSLGKLQELQYGADKVDVPFTKVATSIDNFNKKLAELKPVTVDALLSLGFSLDQVFAMNPDERFDTIGTAIGNIADKTKRTHLEVALFGTDAIDPLITHLKDLEEQARKTNAVVNDDNIKAMNQTVQMYKALGGQVHTFFTDLIVDSQNAVAALAKPVMGGGTGSLVSMIAAMIGSGGNLSEALKAATNSMREPAHDINLPAPGASSSSSGGGGSSGSDLFGQAYIDSLWAQSTAVKALTEVQKDEVRQLIELDAWTADNAAKIGLSSLQYREITKDLQDQAKAQREAEAAAKHRHTIEQEALLITTKLWDEYDQIISTGTGTALDAQIEAIDRWAEDVAAKAQKAGTDINGFYDALTAVWTAKLGALMVDNKALQQAATTDSVRGLEQIRDKALNTYNEALKQVGVWSDGTIAKFKATYDAAQKALDMWGTDNDAWLNSQIQKEKALTDAINREAEARRQASMGVDLTHGSYAVPTSDSLTAAGIYQGISVSGYSIPMRDSGGPVTAGRPYMVGKGAQPEMFIPSSNGFMVPNGMGGGINVSIPISISTLTPGDPRTMEVLRQSIDQAVVQSLRNLVRLPRA